MAFGVVTSPGRLIYRFLDTEGDGTGEVNMTGNYTAPNETPFFQIADESMVVSQVVISMLAPKFEATSYGGDRNTPLANGLQMYILDDEGNVPTNPSARGAGPIKVINDFSKGGWYVNEKKKMIQCRWNLEETGSGMWLPKGWRLGIYLQDDFTHLSEHTAIVHGYKTSENMARFTF